MCDSIVCSNPGPEPPIPRGVPSEKHDAIIRIILDEGCE